MNIGSVAGFAALPLNGIYSPSKFALEAITDVYRRELGVFGVSVSIVDPAYVSSDIAIKNTGENVAWKNNTKEQVFYNFFCVLLVCPFLLLLLCYTLCMRIV